jgi:transposase InsO family protein
MADGGYRPAYNVQLATDVASRAIVGVAVTNLGSDRASLSPMLAHVQRRTGRYPDAALVDGGCFTREAVTDAAAHGVTVYAPLAKRPGGAIATPRPDDS